MGRRGKQSQRIPRATDGRLIAILVSVAFRLGSHRDVHTVLLRVLRDLCGKGSYFPAPRTAPPVMTFGASRPVQLCNLLQFYTDFSRLSRDPRPSLKSVKAQCFRILWPLSFVSYLENHPAFHYRHQKRQPSSQPRAGRKNRHAVGGRPLLATGFPQPLGVHCLHGSRSLIPGHLRFFQQRSCVQRHVAARCIQKP